MTDKSRRKYIHTLQYEMMEKFSAVKDSPVILCIGSTKVAGDSLGPIVGDLLVKKYDVPAFVYGTTDKPVTAVNIEAISRLVELAHEGRSVIAVDAAVGEADSIGEIRISDDGIYPGLATGKVLPKVGTQSVIGIVEERSYFSGTLLENTRMMLVRDMAETMAMAISDFLLMAKARNAIMTEVNAAGGLCGALM